MKLIRPQGKSVIQYYPDGNAGGVMCIEMPNWNGLGFRIPRELLGVAASLDHANTPGVYILLGSNEADEPMAYVGKSEAILRRLNYHALQKDFWTEAIAFVSKDGHLNAGHIGWLEHNAYQLVASARKVKLENSSVPGEPSLSVAVRDAAAEFLCNAVFLLSAMGKNFMESTEDAIESQLNSASGEKSPDLFLIDPKRRIDAKGVQLNNRFILLKGTQIHARGVDSTPKNAHVLLDLQKTNGTVEHLGNDHYRTLEDLEFSSPSQAGMFVTFRSTNGRDAWKLQDGRTLKEYQNGELERVEGRNLFSDAEPLDPSTASDEN